MEAIRRFLKEYWKTLAGVVAVIALVFKMDKLVELLRSWVATGVKPVGHQFLLSTAWGWVLAMVAVALIASLGLSLKLVFELSGLRQEQLAKGQVREKTLQGMMQAANRIANQLYPLAERPPFAFEHVRWSFHVDADGTTRVRALYEIRADERPLHFWRFGLGAEPEAPGVEFLDSIEFKVHDETGADRVAYLMGRNDSHSKEISVFFLPQISPQEAPRTIVVTYTWPEMVKRLLTKGDEEFSLTLLPHTQVPQLEYSVLFHPKLHSSHVLDFKRESAWIDGEVLKKVKEEDSGWAGWSYRISKAPAAGFRYQWRLTAKRR